jgi:hypothetical protein
MSQFTLPRNAVASVSLASAWPDADFSAFPENPGRE